MKREASLRLANAAGLVFGILAGGGEARATTLDVTYTGVIQAATLTAGDVCRHASSDFAGISDGKGCGRAS